MRETKNPEPTEDRTHTHTHTPNSLSTGHELQTIAPPPPPPPHTTDAPASKESLVRGHASRGLSVAHQLIVVELKGTCESGA